MMNRVLLLVLALLPGMVGRTPRSAAGLSGVMRLILWQGTGPGGPARTGGSAPQAPDTVAFDAFLKRYVEENGTVRYGALRADLAPLSRFVEQIGAVSPDSHPALFPTRAHRWRIG